MKLLKSRYSGKKFLSIIHQLLEHKLEAIKGFGFGGLDVVVHSRRGLTSQVYSLNMLEEKLIDLDIIDLHVLIHFMKLCYRWFLIRSLDKQKKNCCSIAPNTILTPQPLQPLPQALVERYGLYNH